MSESITIHRRTILQAGIATAAVFPLLAACATGGGSGDDDEETTEPTGDVDPDNPFNVPADVEVDTVIFDGGYGIDYVEFAADLFEQLHEGSSVAVAPSTQIATEMQPRFVGGNPPDLIDNSGAQAMGFNTILEQLEDLNDVFDAPNLEGEIIRDTVYAGSELPGTFNDKFVAINYVLTVYGVWYSGSLFDENGWTPPTTWDEAKELGAAAAEQDLKLFVWGQEAATYYQTLAVDSAIIEAGDELRLALENLQPDCWSHEALQDVFAALKEIVDLGYFVPGGSGTQFTAAQARWSNDRQALLYPSGSWIENEMNKENQVAEGFEMKGVATWPLSSSSAMPAGTLHSTAGEPFVVPTDANSVESGKEMIRIMLSREAAENFARSKLAPTIVMDTVPEDGFGSTALVSQQEMLAAAGENKFTWNFVGTYGMNQEQLVIWNSFLDGAKSVDDLTSELQAITDRIREDDSIEKIEVV
ncbi:extracellular solute-binding protein family 1 [Beutenbergia cavernae DSM 12333]|uniref:Extracellular solute-binding protein family 1 n=1 Tax=Beutenbergia cavernae (strain ATCC BAA-8 / DSM 12333 / CCUG 43141 / JCM 11478 / NBRC 16432 / NCIMB 13614 / HKI 0122) TaxID=471853 RepID=C5C597_BEUC1|nr:N-acetylglucosamine/diacetylchitobiose ABC transporter substrate-binding protein [Beutenbergia cavernae]ACQ82237.1 extracellular solute-binding protein family 1 [Beutenbergia cavernae DSM 12333]